MMSGWSPIQELEMEQNDRDRRDEEAWEKYGLTTEEMHEGETMEDWMEEQHRKSEQQDFEEEENDSQIRAERNFMSTGRI